MNDIGLSILATTGKAASAKETGIEAKCKASMRAAREGDFMLFGDDAQFRGGLGGVLLDIGNDSEDGQRILDSLKVIRQFNAFVSAASAGLSVEPPTVPEGDEMLPLIAWWNEVREQCEPK